MKKITIYTSGSTKKNPGLAAIGVCVKDADGAVLFEVSEVIGNAFADYVAYAAVARGLQAVVDHFENETKNLHVELQLDNEFVKQQLAGERQIMEPGLVPLFIEINNLRVANFPYITFTHLDRECNAEAGKLADEKLGL
jgi:ribonuclease HI